MAAPINKKNVELGFLEESEPFLLKSRFFPSKFGGRPAWLSLKNLPSPEELSCRACSKPTTFLLQLSAPLDMEETFHRTLFIFVCTNPKCCNPNTAGNFHVFRSQLSRKNEFYKFDPPVERPVPAGEDIDASCYNKLCQVCGASGPKTCSSCCKVNYCSKDHQKIDWKKYHKQECSKESQSEDVACEKEYSLLFTEMDIVSEEEPKLAPESSSEKKDDDKLKEYETFLKSEQSSTMLKGNFTDTELTDMAGKETENDKQLIKFKNRISVEPDQVLRYHRGGEPLWIAKSPIPDTVPNCDCGASREFEFQILPQLLSSMKVDRCEASLDWGTLCIYTCTKSCSVGAQYKREFIFKQDIT